MVESPATGSPRFRHARESFPRHLPAAALGLFCTLLAAVEPPCPFPPGPVLPVSISVADDGLRIAADGRLRIAGIQAHLASRTGAGQPWTEERVPYRVVAADADHLTLEAVFRPARVTVRCDRLDAAWWTLSGSLTITATEPVELARFHYLDGTLADRSLNLLSMRRFELPGRLVRPDDAMPAPRAACEKGWGGVYWPRLAEPVHDRADTAISGDTALLAARWNAPGLFIGFTGPGTAFGEIGIRTRQTSTPCFVAVLLDGIRLAPGIVCPLEQVVIAGGDGQDALRRWAWMCRDVFGPARTPPPLVGYCSWYQTGQKVLPADIRRATTGFAPFPAPPGGRTIQIDDGFQRMPGDWSGRGEWQEALPVLAQEIATAGFIPGLWVAPTAIHASHPLVREHPDWLQRDAQGRPCIRFHNWRNFGSGDDRTTCFLDPDHPQARAWMADMLRGLKAQGWRYFKIDFAYTVSTDRMKHDVSRTTFETLRDQWRLFRTALGEDALINSCNGGMWRYTIGTVDLSRIGGDIGAHPKALRHNLAEMMLRTHVNGIWFQTDPDVWYLRSERSKLTFEQSHLLTATQGLMGGAFLTSDFADQWDARATAVARRWWNADGPRAPKAIHITLSDDDLPATFTAAYATDHFAVGVYNWQAGAADVVVDLDAARLPGHRPFTARHAAHGDEPLTLDGRRLTVHGMPSDSLRIIDLTAAPSGP